MLDPSPIGFLLCVETVNIECIGALADRLELGLARRRPAGILRIADSLVARYVGNSTTDRSVKFIKVHCSLLLSKVG